MLVYMFHNLAMGSCHIDVSVTRHIFQFSEFSHSS